MNLETRRSLQQALTRIDRPGSFCVVGSAPTILPGLEVAGSGPIGLPLTVKQAKDLIKCCEQAPYGKGEKTLVDTSVRRVRHLKPDRFSLTNPDWDTFVEATVAKVQEELGLEKQKLESRLYDLLLYEPGSFFLPHRDGEKLDRMVATLVIALPSTYEGGELVVRHEGHERVVDFRSPDANPFHTHFAAFYADCEHEVRPLRKGYRLCLVYNLTLAKSKKTILAPRESEHVESIREMLLEWSKDESADKLVITLDHQYTANGLTWDALKGVDRAKAKILQEAAGKADCKSFLAMLTLHESGSAEYGGRGRRKGGGWGRFDEYDSGDADDYEMGEIFETSLTATPCGHGEDQTLPIGELKVDEAELLDPDTLREIEPESEFEGYTGNAGMTIEQWYRHAAIVLWPESRHYEILCNRDGRDAVPELHRMVTQWQASGSDEASPLKSQCIKLGNAILKAWHERQRIRISVKESKTPDLLAALDALGNLKLISRALRDLLPKDVTLEPGKSITSICETHGWTTFQDELVTVMEATSNESIGRNVRLLEHICSVKPKKKSGWSLLCSTLAHAFVTALERVDLAVSPKDRDAMRADYSEVFICLNRSLILSGQFDLLARAMDHALASTRLYPLTPTQMTALTSLGPWFKKNVKSPCAALTTWLTASREQLESLTARHPEPPTDFRRAAALACKCVDCTELKRFLADPLEASHRFSVRQDRRNHLTQTIHHHKCDLDLKTEERGSPHTLICTKNTASFHERVKTYDQHRTHLETVRSIERSLPR